MIALFIGSESGSGSSQLTRSSQLAVPALWSGRALGTVGSPSDGPHSPDAAPTRSRASRWMAIRRLGVIAFLSLSRGAAPALASTPWQGVGEAQGPVPSQRLLLSAFIACRAPPPWVSSSPAPIPSRGHGGSKDPRRAAVPPLLLAAI